MNNFVKRWRLQSAALFANHAHATNLLTKLIMSFLQISFEFSKICFNQLQKLLKRLDILQSSLAIWLH